MFVGTESVIRYKDFVREGIDKETHDFYQCKHHSSIFGNEDFITEKLNQLTTAKIQASPDGYNRSVIKPCMLAIDLGISRYFNIHLSDLYKNRRGVNSYPRMLAIYMSRYWSRVRVHQIAQRYNYTSHTSVCYSLNKIRLNSSIHKQISQDIEGIIVEIKKLRNIRIKNRQPTT